MTMKRRIVSRLLILVLILTLPFTPAWDEGAKALSPTFTLSVEAFGVGLGYLVEPVQIPLEEGKTTAYYVDQVLSQRGLTHNGGDVANEGFYLSSISASTLEGTLSIPKALTDKWDAASIPYSTERSDGAALSAGDVTATSGWMSTTNNRFSDYGMGLEVPAPNDVIRLQFSTVGYGEDLGAVENDWTKPYFGTIDKDALTKTLASFLSLPNKDALLQEPSVQALYAQALTYIQQPDVAQAVLDEACSALEQILAPFAPPEEVNAVWANFRGSSTNMAIRNALTPNSPENADLSWAKKFGADWTQSPSAMILIDDSLVTMSGDHLYKLDPKTGEVLQSVQMSGSPSMGAHIPPIYANGIIVAPLDDGILQAFEAKTLTPLWTYADPLGGQALSHIAYSDGYLYVGFWNSNTEEANFLCLSIYNETKKEPLWTYTHKGGFYWTGALVVGDAVIVGSDSGSSLKDGTENSHLYVFDKQTGTILCDLDDIKGDQRSALSYDEENASLYFTTKSGYLYSAKVDEATGMITEHRGRQLGAGLQSTSTPVVYKGRVYIGLSDKTFTVLDAQTLETIYQLPMRGYPQSSFLLSTAYEKEDGYLYFYGTYNAEPGGVTMIRTRADASSEEDASVEELFPLSASHVDAYGNYCVDGVICGTDGTLYYKNDSGYLFAIIKEVKESPAPPSSQPSDPPADPAPTAPALTEPTPAPTVRPKATAKPKPAAPKSIRAKVKKAKKSKNYTLTLSWKKVKNAKGYELYFASKPNATYRKQKSTTKTKIILRKQKKGKRYLKIRSYSLNGGKKLRSSFSKRITVVLK